ncbi:MAG: AAA family ATPase [Poseidonia sp.]
MQGQHARGYHAFDGLMPSTADRFNYHRFNHRTMSDACTLAISGTPGVGKTALCSRLAEAGWTVIDLAELAAEHGCLGETDSADGAAPVDIHRLADAWQPPTEGRWVVDGHLSHLLDVDGLVLLRCPPATLSERLTNRGYTEAKVKANVEWELTAGHWSELLEFEVDLPLMEANSGTMSEDELTQQVLQWVEDGLPSEPLEDMAVHATDWLAQSGA